MGSGFEPRFVQYSLMTVFSVGREHYKELEVPNPTWEFSQIRSSTAEISPGSQQTSLGDLEAHFAARG